MLESMRKAQELMAMAGLLRHGAADALRSHDWDVRKALVALVESGEVTLADLRRDVCPPDVVAAAEANAAVNVSAAAERNRELAAFAADPARREFPSLVQDDGTRDFTRSASAPSGRTR